MILLFIKIYGKIFGKGYPNTNTDIVMWGAVIDGVMVQIIAILIVLALR